MYSGVNHLPASYHRRHAVLSYFAGASAINIEGGDGLVDGTGTQATLLGQEMQRFGAFAKAHQADRRRRADQHRSRSSAGTRTSGLVCSPPSFVTSSSSSSSSGSSSSGGGGGGGSAERVVCAMRRRQQQRPARASAEQLGPTGAGVAVTPVVVILPRDHSYQTRPYWATQMASASYSRLAPRQGDAGIAGFFGHAFPGMSFAQVRWWAITIRNAGCLCR